MGVPVSFGNRVRILRNGVEIFPAMLEAIRAARDSIDFLTFVYWTGDVADQFSRALAERARAGVRVRVLLDAVGARAMPDAHVERMRDAGAEVVVFRPPVRWKLWQSTHRTHRKVLVCDRRLGFTGGVGIASEWEGDAEQPGEWRETHFEIEGPAVRGLQAAFLDNWLETRPRDLASESPRPTSAVGSVAIQVARSAPRIGWSDTATLQNHLIRKARREIRLTTAYFVPSRIAIDELVAAAARGVRVRILVPGPHIDTRLSQLGGRDCYAELLEGGVAIFEFQPTMIHAKILTIDGSIAAIGSCNFNQRSITKDDEILLTLVDEETVARLDADFERDLLRAEAIELEQWRERGLWERLLEAATRLIRPSI